MGLFSKQFPLKRAVQFVWQGGPGWMLLNAALVLIQGLLPLISLYLMKLVIDQISTAHGTAHSPDSLMHSPDSLMHSPDSLRRVFFLVAVTAAITLLGSVMRALSSLLGEAQAERVAHRIQDVIHTKSVALDLEYYENAHYHDTFHRAQQEAPMRPTHIVSNLTQVIQSAVSLLAIAGLLIATLHGVFLLVLAAAVPGVLFRLASAKGSFELKRQQTAAERKVTYYNYLLTLEHYAKEIRLFSLGPLFRQRAGRLRTELWQARLKTVKRRAIGEVVAQTCVTAAIFGSFAYLAYGAVMGTITLGTMIMYYQAFQRGQSALQELLGSLGELYENNLFLSNLYEFLDLEPKISDPKSALPIPVPMQTGIKLENVSFRYTDGTQNVLDGVTLELRVGETLALVGENGAGKSTLIKLLCRLYDPTDGRITLDGSDLREMRCDDLRRQIGVVFQDYVQYFMTARENIWIGNVDCPQDSDKLCDAAEKSGAHDVIQGLPQRYETMLGNWFEDGRELSVGQWQKIAIARAFFREAQILILDEPTSALDAESEFEVFQKFRELARGKTALIISHRLSTVRMADRIVVLQQGHIVENGTHSHLMGLNGVYARMFSLQADQYAAT